jgi:hypothetical protein
MFCQDPQVGICGQILRHSQRNPYMHQTGLATAQVQPDTASRKILTLLRLCQ